MKSKLISFILIISIIIECSGVVAFAATKSELNEQSNKIDNQIKETESEIGDVQTQLSETMQEIQDLIEQISDYEDDIEELNEQISEKEDEISSKEKEIDKAQSDLEDKQDLLDRRLVALYESGQTSYIDLLLSSDDLTDFVSKYYLISEIATYDTNLINEIEELKENLESAKEELELAKVDLENNKLDLEEEQNELNILKETKETKVANLTEEEKELESELSQLEADKKDVQKKIEELAKQEAYGSLGSASAYGYIFPVVGLSKANISNLNYPSYRGHTGVDININVSGKSVVAVKSGTVVTSEAKVRNGSYYSYGEYVIINHHDGTMTLYAHMKAGSRKVSVGDNVSQGQVIGTVGSTGNSTGPHLHFEVWLNGKVVNPIPYLP